MLASMSPPPLAPQHVHPHVDVMLPMMHPTVSPAQVDFAVRAYQRFNTTLPDGETTAGIWNCSGTGLGKTRDLVALMTLRFLQARLLAAGKLKPVHTPQYVQRLEGRAPAYSEGLGDRKVLWLSPSAELAPPLLAEISSVNLKSGIGSVMGRGNMFPVVNMCKLPFKPRRLQTYTLRELAKSGSLYNVADISEDRLDDVFTEGVLFMTYSALVRVGKGVKVPAPGRVNGGAKDKTAPTSKRSRVDSNAPVVGVVEGAAENGGIDVEFDVDDDVGGRSADRKRVDPGEAAAASAAAVHMKYVGRGAGGAAAAYAAAEFDYSSALDALQQMTLVNPAKRAAFFQDDRLPANKYEQVLLWLGPESTAMICLDESHMAKNAVPLSVETEMDTLLESGVKRAERVLALMSGGGRGEGRYSTSSYGGAGVSGGAPIKAKEIRETAEEMEWLATVMPGFNAGGVTGAAASGNGAARESVGEGTGASRGRGRGSGHRGSGRAGITIDEATVGEAADGSWWTLYPSPLSRLPGMEGRATLPCLSGVSKTGVLVLRLQNTLPRAHVCYISATGATEIRHLCYMTRLGLFQGIISKADAAKMDFRSIVLSELESLGGVAAVQQKIERAASVLNETRAAAERAAKLLAIARADAARMTYMPPMRASSNVAYATGDFFERRRAADAEVTRKTRDYDVLLKRVAEAELASAAIGGSIISGLKASRMSAKHETVVPYGGSGARAVAGAFSGAVSAAAVTASCGAKGGVSGSAESSVVVSCSASVIDLRSDSEDDTVKKSPPPAPSKGPPVVGGGGGAAAAAATAAAAADNGSKVLDTYPFESFFQMLQFLSGKGSTSTMIELVAGFMYSSGLYISRMLSYDGVTQFTLRAEANEAVEVLQSDAARAVRIMTSAMSSVYSVGQRMIAETSTPCIDFADLYPYLHVPLRLPNGASLHIQRKPEWQALPAMLRLALSQQPFEGAVGLRSMYYGGEKSASVGRNILGAYVGSGVQQVLKQVQLSAVVSPVVHAVRHMLAQKSAVVISLISTGESATRSKAGGAAALKTAMRAAAAATASSVTAGAPPDDEADERQHLGDGGGGGGRDNDGDGFAGDLAGFGAAAAAAAPLTAVPLPRPLKHRGIKAALVRSLPKRPAGKESARRSAVMPPDGLLNESSAAAAAAAATATTAGARKGKASSGKRSRNVNSYGESDGDTEAETNDERDGTSNHRTGVGEVRQSGVDGDAVDGGGEDRASAPAERLKLAAHRFPVPPVPLAVLQEVGLFQYLPGGVPVRVCRRGNAQANEHGDRAAAGGDGAAPTKRVADYRVDSEDGSPIFHDPLGDEPSNRQGQDLWLAAAACMQAFLEYVTKLDLPPSPLDALTAALGVDNVAEVSGRKTRLRFAATEPRVVLDDGGRVVNLGPIDRQLERAIRAASDPAATAVAAHADGDVGTRSGTRDGRQNKVNVTAPDAAQVSIFDHVDDDSAAVAAPAAASTTNFGEDDGDNDAAAAAAAAPAAIGVTNYEDTDDDDVVIVVEDSQSGKKEAAAAPFPSVGGRAHFFRAASRSAKGKIAQMRKAELEVHEEVVAATEHVDFVEPHLSAAEPAARGRDSVRRRFDDGGDNNDGASMTEPMDEDSAVTALSDVDRGLGDASALAGDITSAKKYWLTRDKYISAKVPRQLRVNEDGDLFVVPVVPEGLISAALDEFGALSSAPGSAVSATVSAAAKSAHSSMAAPAATMLGTRAAPPRSRDFSKLAVFTLDDDIATAGATSAELAEFAAAPVSRPPPSPSVARKVTFKGRLFQQRAPNGAAGAVGMANGSSRLSPNGAPLVASIRAVQARIDAVARRGADVLRQHAEPLKLFKGHWKLESISDKERSAAVSDFQSGLKPIAVVTAAGSLGRSLHAARDCGNPARRAHFICEVPWSADALNQIEGRTHRVGGAPPTYVYVVSPFPSQARFIMAAQARLSQLGAYRGDRRTGGAGDLSEFNYLSELGSKALANMFGFLLGGAHATEVFARLGVSFDFVATSFEGVLNRVCLSESVRTQALAGVAEDFALFATERRPGTDWPLYEQHVTELAQARAAVEAILEGAGGVASGVSGQQDLAALSSALRRVALLRKRDDWYKASLLRAHCRGYLVDMGLMTLEDAAPRQTAAAAEHARMMAAADAAAALREQAAADARNPIEEEVIQAFAILRSTPAFARMDARSQLFALESARRDVLTRHAERAAATATAAAHRDCAPEPVAAAHAAGAATTAAAAGYGGGAGGVIDTEAAADEDQRQYEAAAATDPRTSWWRSSSVAPLLLQLIYGRDDFARRLHEVAEPLVKLLMQADAKTGPLVSATRNPWEQPTVTGPNFISARLVIADGAHTNIKAFFNRLLRLPLPPQNAVFALYQVFFDSTLQQIKAAGELDKTLTKFGADACTAQVLADSTKHVASVAAARAKLVFHPPTVAAAPTASSTTLPPIPRVPAPSWLTRQAVAARPTLDDDLILVADGTRDLPSGLLQSFKQTPLARKPIPGLNGWHSLETNTVELVIDRGMPIEVAAALYLLKLPVVPAGGADAERKRGGLYVTAAAAASRTLALTGMCKHFNTAPEALLGVAYTEVMQHAMLDNRLRHEAAEAAAAAVAAAETAANAHGGEASGGSKKAGASTAAAAFEPQAAATMAAAAAADRRVVATSAAADILNAPGYLDLALMCPYWTFSAMRIPQPQDGQQNNLTGFWYLDPHFDYQGMRNAEYRPASPLERGPFMVIDSGGYRSNGALRRDVQFFHPRVGAFTPSAQMKVRLRLCWQSNGDGGAFKKYRSFKLLSSDWADSFNSAPDECAHENACKLGRRACPVGRRLLPKFFIAGCLLPVIKDAHEAMTAEKLRLDRLHKEIQTAAIEMGERGASEHAISAYKQRVLDEDAQSDISEDEDDDDDDDDVEGGLDSESSCGGHIDSAAAAAVNAVIGKRAFTDAEYIGSDGDSGDGGDGDESGYEEYGHEYLAHAGSRAIDVTMRSSVQAQRAALQAKREARIVARRERDAARATMTNPGALASGVRRLAKDAFALDIQLLELLDGQRVVCLAVPSELVRGTARALRAKFAHTLSLPPSLGAAREAAAAAAAAAAAVAGAGTAAAVGGSLSTNALVRLERPKLSLYGQLPKHPASVARTTVVVAAAAVSKSRARAGGAGSAASEASVGSETRGLIKLINSMEHNWSQLQLQPGVLRKATLVREEAAATRAARAWVADTAAAAAAASAGAAAAGAGTGASGVGAAYVAAQIEKELAIESVLRQTEIDSEALRNKEQAKRAKHASSSAAHVITERESVSSDEDDDGSDLDDFIVADDDVDGEAFDDEFTDGGGIQASKDKKKAERASAREAKMAAKAAAKASEKAAKAAIRKERKEHVTLAKEPAATKKALKKRTIVADSVDGDDEGEAVLDVNNTGDDNGDNGDGDDGDVGKAASSRKGETRVRTARMVTADAAAVNWDAAASTEEDLPLPISGAARHRRAQSSGASTAAAAAAAAAASAATTDDAHQGSEVETSGAMKRART